MKKHILLLILAAGLTNSLVAMEGDDQRGQKRTIESDELEKTDAAGQTKNKKQKTENEKEEENNTSAQPQQELANPAAAFGALNLPVEVFENILDFVVAPSNGGRGFANFCRLNKSFNALRKPLSDHLNNRLLDEVNQELDDYHAKNRLTESGLSTAAYCLDIECLRRCVPVLYLCERNDVINKLNIHDETPMLLAAKEAIQKFNRLDDSEEVKKHDAIGAEIIDLFNMHGGSMSFELNGYAVNGISCNSVACMVLKSARLNTDNLLRTILPFCKCTDIKEIADWIARNFQIYGYTKEEMENAQALLRKHHQCNKCFPDNQ